MAAAFAFVFSPDGKLLLLKEDEKKRKYMWDLPGGTLSNSEDPLHGLHREVREETGLHIDVMSPTCWLKWDLHESGNPILVAFYLATCRASHVTVSEEHTSYRWVTPAQYFNEQLKVSAEEPIVEDCFTRYQELAAHT
ncbi:NUDIX domain-containing protein [Streptomyces sp. NPDC127066]|uniref:NUDIX domain-containing protein n=1 Tax=Streptomyces sp. NPDC127066 TaxID=3347125 RepID=UPI00366689E9